jgi:hypothetical protein
MKTYNEALKVLNGRKSKRLPKTATTLRMLDNGDIGLEYHSTIVVTYFKDGGYKLDNGGWFTMTTKKRMNDFTDLVVCQSKGKWYVNGYDYHNGIELRRGSIYNVSEI